MINCEMILGITAKMIDAEIQFKNLGFTRSVSEKQARHNVKPDD